jgi:hypothetical protein
MDFSSSPFDLPEVAAIPQTTPMSERRRLVAKGQLLAEHCLDGGGTACVLGFVDHCLGKSPPQLDVVMDLWRELLRDYEQLDKSEDAADEQRHALLHELLQGLTSRLHSALSRSPDASGPEGFAGDRRGT